MVAEQRHGTTVEIERTEEGKVSLVRTEDRELDTILCWETRLTDPLEGEFGRKNIGGKIRPTFTLNGMTYLCRHHR